MTAYFISKVSAYGPRTMLDLGLTDVQAAAIWGNLGHESGGLVQLQEQGHSSGRGGWGLAQWTGPRRHAMEAWCHQHGKSPSDFEANYDYLIVELKGAERGAVSALKQHHDISGATNAFMRTFERPGIPALAHRVTWANLALSAIRHAHGQAPSPAPAPKPAAKKPIADKHAVAPKPVVKRAAPVHASTTKAKHR
jgi:hypothetical protein